MQTNEINKILYNSQIVKNTVSLIENNKTITLIDDKFKRAFHNLLWLEELQTVIDIRQYDTVCQIKRNISGEGIFKELYEITLAKLAEKRPSVLVGDIIYAYYDQVKHVNEDVLFIG